jgi:hypothetical protein
MSAPTFITVLTGSALVVDASTPNVAEPSELRVFVGTSGKDTDPTALYAAPVGGGITLQVWGYVAQLKRWMAIGAATACAVDAITQLPTPPVGTAKLYAQLTVNTTCTQYAIGFMGGR